MNGPRILAANYAICVPNGHMAGSVSRVASSVDEAVAMVEDLASHNVDLIKLMITGGVMYAKVKGEPGILMMKPDMIKACCDAAHKHNLPVAAHVQSPDGVRAAVRNGVDTIEHGYVLTSHEIDAFKEKTRRWFARCRRHCRWQSSRARYWALPTLFSIIQMLCSIIW